jgi:cytochrome b561
MLPRRGNAPVQSEGASVVGPVRTNRSETASGAAPSARYDETTIRLHWLTAAMVVLLWTIGQVIDFFPRGLPRTGARSAHIVLGAALAILVVTRLVWRLRFGRTLPAADAGLVGLLARCVHWGLYLLLIATVGLGLSNACIRGDTIIWLFKIPSLAPGNKELRELVEKLHGTSANALLIVAGLHAAAGLVHHFKLRDGVLRRMLLQRAAR